MNDIQRLITGMYEAFNRRDIDGVLAHMTESVDWPKASEGGRAEGKDEIRAYWLRQWAEYEPRVEPLEVVEPVDGVTGVRVHQIVKNLEGDVLSDQEVWHLYRIVDGRIDRMDVKESAPSFGKTSAG